MNEHIYEYGNMVKQCSKQIEQLLDYVQSDTFQMQKNQKGNTTAG